MHHARMIRLVVVWLTICLVASVVTAGMVPASSRATIRLQEGSPAKSHADEPVFHEYKGVVIGMKADDARKKLGKPSEKDDEQDFYIFSDTESAQVYYDKTKTVNAVSVNYVGEGSDVPKPKAVLGTDVKAKPDGAIHELIRFPEAGYWVSYSRTAGNSPITTITFKKIE